MNNDILIRLSAQLEHLTPHVYRVLMRQVYVSAVQDVIWAVSALALVWWLHRKLLAIGQHNLSEDPDRWLVWHLVRLGIATALIVVLVAFGSIVSTLLNPEYSAIRLLLHPNS